MANRAEWRAWLAANHDKETEAWLCIPDPHTGLTCVPYVESVLEGLCFGWIDGLQKRLDPNWRVQRFTPRRPKGNWTELNKHRSRQLIVAGLMTDAGLRTLPGLDFNKWTCPPDIAAALEANPEASKYWAQMPMVYKRMRVDYVEERRRLPVEFEKSLNSLVTQVAEGKMFGYFLPEIGFDPKGKRTMSYEMWMAQLPHISPDLLA